MPSHAHVLPRQVEELLSFLERHAVGGSQPVHCPEEKFAAEDLALTALMLVQRTRREPELAWSARWLATLQMFADLYGEGVRVPRPRVPEPRSGS